MRKRFILKSVCIVFLVFNLQSCSAPEDPKLVTTKILLQKIWLLKNVTIDGVQSDLYSGLSIDFSENSFTSTKGGALWPSFGQWKFGDSEGKVIVRNDGLEISIESITSESFIISFLWTKTTLSGRGKSLSGLHKMVFRPN